MATAWAGKLLVDMGAEVVKVEPPEGDPARRRGPFPPGSGGDPERSGLFLGLNAGKRSVVVEDGDDETHPPGRRRRPGRARLDRRRAVGPVCATTTRRWSSAPSPPSA